jgi:hypothetical protein
MTMTEAKKKFEKFITPRGVLVFPRLNEPDTKFKADGEYSTKVRFNLGNPGVAAFIERVKQQHVASLAAAKVELAEKAKAETDPRKKKKLADALAKVESGPDPVKPTVLDDGSESTDLVEVNFKMPAKRKGKDGLVKEQSPTLQDALEQPIARSTAIWGGSEGRIAGFFLPYYNAATDGAGVSVRLNAVQILKLVSKGSQSFGFGKDEEGYVSEPKGDSPFSSDEGTTSGEESAPAGDATSGVNF